VAYFTLFWSDLVYVVVYFVFAWGIFPFLYILYCFGRWFLKNVEVVKILLVHNEAYVSFLTKMGLGFILGDLFTNSSCHYVYFRQVLLK
jgi:hypothetical protein